MSDPTTRTRPRLELWGGVECTVNRLGESYLDQIDRTRHAERLTDFNLFAQLGIKAIRQPVLWERTAPRHPEQLSSSWSDAALERIRELNIRPIAGLVHHGSGPRYTSLLDPEFPRLLAAYALAVARRYPWIDDYTPVNEPLTTARFSGLYGLWYPHARSDRAFARILLNECRATVCAMRAIRTVNPGARLVQTDDLGKAFSTPNLSYQADFENGRRWLSFDLLCGRVDTQHPFWKHLIGSGIEPDELLWFLDNPCIPDLVGINHYLSGERFLDEHLERYPPDTHGGNARERYADVLAARVRIEGVDGPEQLLAEAARRYDLPIAITECHNGCTREEQLRWFLEVWRGAQRLHDSGVDVRAVT
ncbi:MAG: dTDP-4-dehydrorhamnose reductase, partial [Acidobacteria bacterium]|nr:dTDP-4-dehydrorhamnose reductase [Acidobacteriota bacterium]